MRTATDVEREWIDQMRASPMHSDEWIAEWMTLDHTWCAQYLDDPELTIDEYYKVPSYVTCRSMHCPHCKKSCGSQGHRNCQDKEHQDAPTV